MRGRRGDARTDVYALGTLLYEMLTGRLPWEAPSTLALLRAKRSRDATPPRAHCSSLDPALEAVLLRALSRDPLDLQASAAEFLADLDDPSAMPARRQMTRRSPAPGRAISLLIAAAVVIPALAWLLRRRQSSSGRP